MRKENERHKQANKKKKKMKKIYFKLVFSYCILFGQRFDLVQILNFKNKSEFHK